MLQSLFVTLFYAQRAPATASLTYVNAGHNPPLLYHAQRNEWVELTRTGIALGIDETLAFEQRAVQFDAGDFVVFYTDGITEATNAQNQEFGVELLRRMLMENCRGPATEIVAAVERALGEFTAGSAQFDDITLVVAKRV